MIKYFIMNAPVFFLAITATASKKIGGIPLPIIASSLFLVFYIGSPVLLLQKHRSFITYTRKTPKNSLQKVKISYYIFTFVMLLSTLFGEETSHYLNSVFYLLLSLIMPFFLFRYFEKYKGVNTTAAWGLFMLGIMTSVLIWYLFISTGGGFVRNFPVDSLFSDIFQFAGHYRILLLALIGGILLVGYELDARKSFKNGKKTFNVIIYIFLPGIGLTISGILLTLGRGTLLIALAFIALFVLFFGKKKLKVISIFVLVMLSFFLAGYQSFFRSRIFSRYQGRFSELFEKRETALLQRLVDQSREDLNRIIIENYTFSVLGKGRGAASHLTTSYTGIGPHNTYLPTLYDGGMIALLAYLAMLVLLLFYGNQRRNVAGFILSCIGTYLIMISGFSSEDHISIALCIALSCGAYRHLQEQSLKPEITLRQ